MYHQYVTAYEIEYRGNRKGGKWTRVLGLLKGNTDTQTCVGHVIRPAVECRYIRFLPVAWREHIALRLEVYGVRPRDSFGRAE